MHGNIAQPFTRPRGAQVTVADSEPAESALRRFRKSVLNSGVLPEVRIHARASCPRPLQRAGCAPRLCLSRPPPRAHHGLHSEKGCSRRRPRPRASVRRAQPRRVAGNPISRAGCSAATAPPRGARAREPVRSLISRRGSAAAFAPAPVRTCDAHARALRSSAAATSRTRRTSRSASCPLVSRRSSGESAASSAHRASHASSDAPSPQPACR